MSLRTLSTRSPPIPATATTVPELDVSLAAKSPSSRPPRPAPKPIPSRFRILPPPPRLDELSQINDYLRYMLSPRRPLSPVLRLARIEHAFPEPPPAGDPPPEHGASPRLLDGVSGLEEFVDPHADPAPASVEEPPRPARPPLTATARGIVLRVLSHCAALELAPDAQLLSSLARCAQLDRDWKLVLDLVAAMDHMPLDARIPLWRRALPYIAADAPTLAVGAAQAHLLPDDAPPLFDVLDDHRVASALVEATRHSGEDGVVLLQRLAQVALHAERQGDPGYGLRCALATFIVRNHKGVDAALIAAERDAITRAPLAADPKTGSADEHTVQLVHAMCARDIPAGLALLESSLQSDALLDVAARYLLRDRGHRSMAIKMFASQLGRPRARPSLDTFRSILVHAPRRYACDRVWYRLHRDHGLELTRDAAFDLARWVALNAPVRLGSLVRYYERCRIQLHETPSQWRAFFRSLRASPDCAKVDAKLVLALYELLPRAADPADVLPTRREVDAMFLTHVCALGDADAARELALGRIAQYPIVADGIRGVAGNLPPTLAYGLLRQIWARARNVATVADDAPDIVKLLGTAQKLAARVRPTDCARWARHLDSWLRVLPPNHPARARSDSWSVSVRALGRVGDRDALASIVSNAPALAPGAESEAHNERLAHLATAYARTLQHDEARRVLAGMDPDSAATKHARVAVAAAFLRTGAPVDPARLAAEIKPEPGCIASINVQLAALRNVGDFAALRAIADALGTPPDAATLTIILTAALRAGLADRAFASWAADYIEAHAPRAGHRHHAHLLIDLLATTARDWPRVARIVAAMAADPPLFNGSRNRASHAKHARPSDVTFRGVHRAAAQRLAALGVVDPDEAAVFASAALAQGDGDVDYVAWAEPAATGVGMRIVPSRVVVPRGVDTAEARAILECIERVLEVEAAERRRPRRVPLGSEAAAALERRWDEEYGVGGV
ncbi:hypothetical protein H9P43_002105 [Blastocladiella emersonii ATCC 22665]|nr:hypothetical protein H9P43_002105 [Blastocladiella emersonii ATCC 22665]